MRTGQREVISPSPLQTAAVISGNIERSNNHQEVIEVQILPQDDGWGDNGTAITGNTSVASGSMDDMSRVGGESAGRIGDGHLDPHWSTSGDQHQLGWTFLCQRYIGSTVGVLLGLVALATPIIMVLLPRLQIVPLRSEQLRCSAECEGLLISLTVKLVLLVLGAWAVFWRPTRATMPRIFFLRTLVLLIVFLTTFAYCLFYGVRVVEQQDQLDYKVIHHHQFIHQFIMRHIQIRSWITTTAIDKRVDMHMKSRLYAHSHTRQPRWISSWVCTFLNDDFSWAGSNPWKALFHCTDIQWDFCYWLVIDDQKNFQSEPKSVKNGSSQSLEKKEHSSIEFIPNPT